MSSGISAEQLRPAPVERAEVWLSVPGYEGVYEISNHGRVRNATTGSVLKPGTNRGYRFVVLYGQPSGPVTHYLHATVLKAFCGAPPFEGAEACHNDGHRDNNRLTNLRWGSRRDNTDDRFRHGRQAFGTGVRNAKLTEQRVRDLRKQYREGKGTRVLAREYGLSANTIWCAVTGKTWRHVEGAVTHVG